MTGQQLKAAMLAVINERKDAKGLSGRSLATAAKLDINTVARKLRGTGDFSVDELEAVAKVLGLKGADGLLREARRRP